MYLTATPFISVEHAHITDWYYCTLMPWYGEPRNTSHAVELCGYSPHYFPHVFCNAVMGRPSCCTAEYHTSPDGSRDSRSSSCRQVKAGLSTSLHVQGDCVLNGGFTGMGSAYQPNRDRVCARHIGPLPPAQLWGDAMPTALRNTIPVSVSDNLQCKM